jgi:hypothetical protein
MLLSYLQELSHDRLVSNKTNFRIITLFFHRKGGYINQNLARYNRGSFQQKTLSIRILIVI